MREITVRTRTHSALVDITSEVARTVTESAVQEGFCTVFVPHTTAGVTINENADPSVVDDIEHALDTLIPWHGPYNHSEGNSAAHIKASLMGSSVHIPVTKGHLMLGTWQAIYFCEFDGPRDRRCIIGVTAEARG
jgi:secondary thiamine-phosphate synthase enzyme